MDVLILASVFATGLVVGDAIFCHDCTSWNPYCRDHVQIPFPDAVATVECKKTERCFVKRDKQGVISRGCADWWEDSQIDVHYDGCRSQEVEWLGKEIWCFCGTDYCNAGPVEELGGHMDIYPALEDYDAAENIVDEPVVKSKHTNEFNDFSANYFLKQEHHLADPAWQIWFWHAESDRPRWTQAGQLEPVHSHEEITDKYDMVHDAAPTVSAMMSRTQNPMERLFPWWYGRITWDDSTDEQPAQSTSIPLEEQWWQPKAQNEVKETSAEEGQGQADKQDSPFDPDSPDQTPDVEPLPSQDITKPEFYCWDCYSDSPLCGDRVNIQRSMYLGKTSCPRTNKCFVRKENDVIYRGCADGWTGSVISTDYVGCRKQSMWNGVVEWCFCTASLCNSDSMAGIENKYVTSLSPQPFRKLPKSQNLTRIPAPEVSPKPATTSKTASSTTAAAVTVSAVPTTSKKPTTTTTAVPTTVQTSTAAKSSPTVTSIRPRYIPKSSIVDASRGIKTSQTLRADSTATRVTARETTPETTAAKISSAQTTGNPPVTTGKPPLTSQSAAANGKASPFKAMIGR